MVAYLQRLKRLNKKVEKLKAKKSSKLKHPFFARIQDNQYWQAQCESATQLLRDLDEMVDALPIVTWKDADMRKLLNGMLAELRGFPTRPPVVLQPTNVDKDPNIYLDWFTMTDEQRAESAARDAASTVQQQVPWRPRQVNGVKSPEPINPMYVNVEDDEFQL